MPMDLWHYIIISPRREDTAIPTRIHHILTREIHQNHVMMESTLLRAITHLSRQRRIFMIMAGDDGRLVINPPIDRKNGPFRPWRSRNWIDELCGWAVSLVSRYCCGVVEYCCQMGLIKPGWIDLTRLIRKMRLVVFLQLTSFEQSTTFLGSCISEETRRPYCFCSTSICAIHVLKENARSEWGFYGRHMQIRRISVNIGWDLWILQPLWKKLNWKSRRFILKKI